MAHQLDGMLHILAAITIQTAEQARDPGLDMRALVLTALASSLFGVVFTVVVGRPLLRILDRAYVWTADTLIRRFSGSGFAERLRRARQNSLEKDILDVSLRLVNTVETYLKCEGTIGRVADLVKRDTFKFLLSIASKSGEEKDEC